MATEMIIITDNSEREYKYLVRELKIMKGEDCKIFPLHYVHKINGRVEIFPFDRERAGFEYKDSLTIEEA